MNVKLIWDKDEINLLKLQIHILRKGKLRN